MKLMNRDLTREKLWVNVSGGQIYISIFSRVHGKWCTQTYFQAYEFEVDRELMDLTIRYVSKLWKLNKPKVFLAFGN